MSEQTEQVEAMAAHLDRIDAGLVKAAAARADFMAELRVALRDAYHSPDKNRQFELDTAFGRGRLDSAIAGRLRALGLQSVLDCGRETGVTDGTWVTKLTNRIRGVLR